MASTLPKAIRSIEHLADFVDSAAIGLHWVRADGTISWANAADYEPLGYSADEYIGHNITEFHADTDVIADILRRLSAGERLCDYEARLRCKDGSIRTVQITSSVLFDHTTNEFVHTRCFTKDVTEQKQLLQELKAALTSRDEFLATVSHELRTPLSAILGWARILLVDKVSNPAMIRKGLETIERAARAQVRLIDDILDMSRIISGKIRIESRHVQVAKFVQGAFDSIAPRAQAKQIELSCDLQDNLSIYGDPDRLQQVIWNLLSNSIKFTPKGGRIAVRTQLKGSAVNIIVEDSGMGIASDVLPHIFERFRQADSSKTRRHGGLGLGLAIARQLAELHGGSITVRSEGLGKGATFELTLPVRALHDGAQRKGAASEEQPTPAPSGGAARLDGLRVLVCDDNEDAREVLSLTLRIRGADVFVATNANEAVALLSSARPNVLISDIGMPGDDGYSLIRSVRRLDASQGAGTPALALSAYVRDEDAKLAFQAGFQRYLRKPADPDELAAIVAELGIT